MSTTTPKRVTYLAALKKNTLCKGCGNPLIQGEPAFQVSVHHYHPGCIPGAARKALGLDTPAPAPVATGTTVTKAQAKALEALEALTGGGKAELDVAKVEKICRDILGSHRSVLVGNGEVVLGKTEGAAHKVLDEVLRLVTTVIDGRRLAVLLKGPAGSGKTHLGAQVSEALTLPFYSISCSAGMSEGHLLGRLLPIGDGGRFEYVRSDFVKAYEEGGVFLMDEVDAADPNTLLVLNSALANGHLSVPMRYENPTALRHADFVILLAGNTFGTGANRTYAGRNALDGAFLNRSATGTLIVDYDEDLEEALCGCKAVAERFRKLRKKVDEKDIKRIVSMRNTIEAAATYKGGPNPKGWRTLDECVEALTAAWSSEERRACGLSEEAPEA